MPEPTKKDMAAARVICACRGACSDLVQPCDRRARIARALSAAREEGRRQGLEKALAVAAEEYSEALREGDGTDAAHDIAMGAIRALIGGDK